MSFKQFYNRLLVESFGGVHISVDVQPEYEDVIPFDIVEYYEWMNESFNEVVVYVNGEELGFPNIEEHKQWLVYEKDVPEEIVYSDKFEFREKGYAFFRSCMDTGRVECLIDIIRYMFDNHITDSRDIDIDDNPFKDQTNCDDILEFIINSGDTINIPDLMFELKDDGFTKVSVSGGGTNECLEEIRLALKALNIKYTDINNYIY